MIRIWVSICKQNILAENLKARRRHIFLKKILQTKVTPQWYLCTNEHPCHQRARPDVLGTQGGRRTLRVEGLHPSGSPSVHPVAPRRGPGSWGNLGAVKTGTVTLRGTPRRPVHTQKRKFWKRNSLTDTRLWIWATPKN